MVDEIKEPEKIEIRNCRFAFRCEMTWEKLISTEREDIRYCSECDRGVYRCGTDDELAEAIKYNRCVAVTLDDRGHQLPQDEWLLGDVVDPGYMENHDG
jgi:hypothetical protein